MTYPMYNQYYPYTQKYDVIKVNGKNGAEAFQMQPNSQVLLLDETQPLVWLKTTDGAGYPTLKAYTITPYEEPKPLDMATLDERLENIEKRLEKYEQSYTTNTYDEHSKQQYPTSEEFDDGYERKSLSSDYRNVKNKSPNKTSARNGKK